jgi:hypothetical protein
MKGVMKCVIWRLGMDDIARPWPELIDKIEGVVGSQ